jgi:hypothetical protein
MNLPLSPSWLKTPLALAGICCLMAVSQAAHAQSSGPPPPPMTPPPGNGPQPSTGQDGNQMIVGNQEYVQIAPGYLLYAEQFFFQDTTSSSGRAVGHVYIQLPPHFALLGVTFIHADSAQFNVREGWIVLRGWPEVVMGSTLHRAASQFTRMRITWLGPNRGLTVVGDEIQETLPAGSIRGVFEGGGPGSGGQGGPPGGGSGPWFSSWLWSATLVKWWARFFPKKFAGHCVNSVSMPSLPSWMKTILLSLIFRTSYKGQVVASCCQDCKAEFEKNPGRYQVKVAEPK